MVLVLWRPRPCSTLMSPAALAARRVVFTEVWLVHDSSAISFLASVQAGQHDASPEQGAAVEQAVAGAPLGRDRDTVEACSLILGRRV
jgi:hypothetical protein